MNELPGGWVEATVSEVGSTTEQAVLTGPFGASLGKADFLSSGVPVFTIGCLGNGYIIEEKLSFISDQKAEELATYRLREGDLMFSRMATVGRVGFVPPKFSGSIFNYHLMRLRLCDAVIEPRFFYHYIKGAELVASYLADKNRGATRDGINTKLLEQLPISLPPLAEQKRIVAKLDALNAKSARACTELASIETLVSRYKQAVLSKAFSGELTREWRHLAVSLPSVKPRQAQQMKPVYRLSLEQAFDAPYDLPKSWEWLTFPSVGDLDRGKSKHRPRNDPRLFDGSFPFIQTGDVRAADQYVREHSQTYSEFGLAQSKLWPPETLCITIAANIAETALLSYPACFPDSVVGFSADEDKMLPKYAEFFLRTAKERISQFAPATAQKNINLEILAAVRLPAAPLEEQHEIVCRIESAFAKIDRLGKEAKRALELVGRLDEAILAKAFRGELVPQNENDESAELPLARIRAEREAAPKARRSRKAVGQ